MGEVIAVPGQRHRYIVAAKCPLSENFDRCMASEDDHFSPDEMLQMMAGRGLPVTAVIDLTKTRRYYDPALFKNEGIAYHKLRVLGRQAPEAAHVAEFTGRIDEHFAAHPSPSQQRPKVVLTHCTHGVNRTAFFLIAYLVKSAGMTLEAAKDLVEIRRGHPIRHSHLIEGLTTMLSGGGESGGGESGSQDSGEKRCREVGGGGGSGGGGEGHTAKKRKAGSVPTFPYDTGT